MRNHLFGFHPTRRPVISLTRMRSLEARICEESSTADIGIRARARQSAARGLSRPQRSLSSSNSLLKNPSFDEFGVIHCGHESVATPERAFAGALTRGRIGTIPAPVETENTRSYQGGVWLMRQSTANRSPRVNSLRTGNLTGNFSNLGLFLQFSLLINQQIQMLAAKFPSKWNREFFCRNRELFLPNREFSRPNRELDLGSIF